MSIPLIGTDVPRQNFPTMDNTTPLAAATTGANVLARPRKIRDFPTMTFEERGAHQSLFSPYRLPNGGIHLLPEGITYFDACHSVTTEVIVINDIIARCAICLRITSSRATAAASGSIYSWVRELHAVSDGSARYWVVESCFLDLQAHPISPLESAVRMSNAQYHDPEFLSPGNPAAWVLPQRCLTSPPLVTVFTADLMHDYRKIFNFLWRLKRIEHQLS